MKISFTREEATCRIAEFTFDKFESLFSDQVKNITLSDLFSGSIHLQDISYFVAMKAEIPLKDWQIALTRISKIGLDILKEKYDVTELGNLIENLNNFFVTGRFKYISLKYSIQCYELLRKIEFENNSYQCSKYRWYANALNGLLSTKYDVENNVDTNSTMFALFNTFLDSIISHQRVIFPSNREYKMYNQAANILKQLCKV